MHGGAGVEGLGFRVEGLGFRVEGLGFRVWGGGEEGLGIWAAGVWGCSSALKNACSIDKVSPNSMWHIL